MPFQERNFPTLSGSPFTDQQNLYDWLLDWHSNLPRCYAYLSAAAQSIGNAAFTAVLFDAELFDIGDFHSLTTNTERLTVPSGAEGLYLIQGAAEFAVGTGLRSVVICKNGAAVPANALAEVLVGAVAGNVTAIQVSVLAFLQVADYVNLVVFQDSGGPLNVNAAAFRTFLSVIRIA